MRLLAAVIVLLLLALVLLDKPWDINVAATIASGEKVALSDFIADGLWWASLVNLVLFIALLVSSGWWLKLKPIPSGAGKRKLSTTQRKLFLFLLLAITGFALIERLPRLSHSLWNDEEYSLRRYVLGYESVSDDGNLRLNRVSWAETLFFNRGANNHIPFSIAAKLTLGAWGVVASEPGKRFAEWVYRLPSLVAGLGAIFVIGWLVGRKGKVITGLAVALALALHPWHLRYSVEARGYAIMLFVIVLGILLLSRALESGRWRDWLGFGLCQLVMMWCFPAAIYLAITLNGLVALFLLWDCIKLRAVTAGLVRFAVANVLSAAAFIQLYSPSVRQVQLYLARDIAQGEMGAGWFRDIGAHLFAGIRYIQDDAGFHQFLSIQNLPFYGQLSLPVGLTCLVLVALGVVRAVMLGRSLSLLVVAPILAGLLAYLHASLSGNFLFSWYLIYVLVGLIPALFLGIEQLASWCSKGQQNTFFRWCQSALCVAVLAGYAFLTAETRYYFQHFDRQPLRPAVALARQLCPNGLLATFGISSRQFASYDAALIPIDKDNTVEELELLESIIQYAHDDRQCLVVLYSGDSRHKHRNSEIFSRLSKSSEFELQGRLYGLEEFFNVEAWVLSRQHAAE